MVKKKLGKKERKRLIGRWCVCGAPRSNTRGTGNKVLVISNVTGLLTNRNVRSLQKMGLAHKKLA